MPNCSICGTTSGFIKAHIIPEAFFRELRNGNEAPLLISGVKGKIPKRSPIGVYDPELLCSSCELKFLLWDTYGVEILLTEFDDYFKPVFNQSEIIAYEAINIDKLKILNFLVSMLWRASVTKIDFYNAVDLGPHEKSVLSLMLANQGNAPAIFDAVLSR